MTFKEKAMEALDEAILWGSGGARDGMIECRGIIADIPDEAHEDIPCAAPNYEDMYHAAQAELMEQKKICENMACELRAMHLNNTRLAGYREAVERIFGEGV